ncbi:MAG: hypothetical protein Kow0069_06400 [Promethearchaeota archaeon]
MEEKVDGQLGASQEPRGASGGGERALQVLLARPEFARHLREDPGMLVSVVPVSARDVETLAREYPGVLPANCVARVENDENDDTGLYVVHALRRNPDAPVPRKSKYYVDVLQGCVVRSLESKW